MPATATPPLPQPCRLPRLLQASLAPRHRGVRAPARLLSPAGRAATLALVLLGAMPARAADTPPGPAAEACWRDLPAGWQGVLGVGSLRDAAVALRADGSSAGAPLRTDTRLNIASLGKMFTAVAVGQLVDEGRLRFEDPAARHLPELRALPEAFHGLTLAQMLSHTAGLGSYLEEQPLARVESAPTARALLPLATAALPHEVGRWRYSNSGYAIAAAVVEAVSGLDYESYVRQRIFAPAGMRSIGFAPAAGDALPTVVDADGRATHPAVGRLRGGPAGGAFATAEDLLRFARALHDGRLLSAATAERITSVQHETGPRRDDGHVRGWGWGFGVTGTGTARLFGHVGGVPGGAAAFRVRVADGRVVVALAPQDRVPPGAWSARLMDMPLARCAGTGAGAP